ncbi:MAG: hypothetical protein K2Y21_13635 [Phycisphaerales bacterium]|nr:hypothetical protein [Phycisphaerales bacterium]
MKKHDSHTDPSAATDPVDTALSALAAPRWSKEPDWRSFQERLMSTRSFGWKKLGVLALLASGCFAAGAAGGVAWERFTFTGVFHAANGQSVNVQGGAVRTDDGRLEMHLNSDGKIDVSGGGTMDITTPNGGKAKLITKPLDLSESKEVTLPDGRKVRVPKEFTDEQIKKIQVSPNHKGI